ncbi:MAG: alanine--tRNA ligase [Verrucomicrobia bacterium]|nr:alanine--tRNA ligase [Verrucomicrobiota bacterium]
MTSAEIRQSFLDFFSSKHHTVVPSSSLMPDSPNLLFTNAGMNQFVPIFLGQTPADVSAMPGAIRPAGLQGASTRAADTQKCIRAGGKHNDLEDVGLDTYHHTFFEMLGNWSFGDYFKKEAIEWAWELITEVWKFPKQRLYATVYRPGPGEPADFDQEAWDHWTRLFTAAGLDPKVHIRNGSKKDNFWMMGETGPCGPCSELHVDLTPEGDTQGALVNEGSPKCIEIWNLVFIQFNANPDGSFSSLPARHVDTGMGFERVASVIQGTRGFQDFANAKISNYETDIFRPIFDELERLSGKTYGCTLPETGADLSKLPPQFSNDIAFRVIADHIRTLSFSIADGIQPGNTDRNYVLRRILRRAVRYGRSLGFREPFFFKLVGVLAETMGDVFPEIRSKATHVQDVIRQEEEAFNKTLDRGLELFEDYARQAHENTSGGGAAFSGDWAFTLYDTYGFPLDLTELMARERGLTVDVAGFNRLMDEQRDRARKAQKRQVIELSQVETTQSTVFSGFDQLEIPARVLEVVDVRKQTAVILDSTVCYAEMGGQVGDTGQLVLGDSSWPILNTQKNGNTWLHLIKTGTAPEPGAELLVRVDRSRRNAIHRHHTVTHLLHWALHEVVSPDASQKGSYVGPEKLTFDFNGAPLSANQLADIEKLVNEQIVENAGVTWTEIPYQDVRGRADVMQFFGDKYGEQVRVVQIGGKPGALDGYSMELCGGTHTRATGEIGLFRILAESAIAAGVRRIEAVAGLEAYHRTHSEFEQLKSVAAQVGCPLPELEKKIEAVLAQQKELEKQLKTAVQKQASETAKQLLAKVQQFDATDSRPAVPVILENLGHADGDTLQSIADALKSQFHGVILLGGTANDAVSLVASVSPEFTSRINAGKLIQAIAPMVGGRGGGRPDNARGGGKDTSKLNEALSKAITLI